MPKLSSYQLPIYTMLVKRYNGNMVVTAHTMESNHDKDIIERALLNGYIEIINENTRDKKYRITSKGIDLRDNYDNNI